MVSQKDFYHGPPNTLIIQQGESNVLAMKESKLCQAFTPDLKILTVHLPFTRLSWSELLKCLEWRASMNQEKLELGRRKCTGKVTTALGSSIIEYLYISFRQEAL